MPDVADLAVIVPSRGRPDAARELAEAFAATCTAKTHLVFAVDDSDPRRHEYLAAAEGVPNAAVVHCPSKTMVEALNQAVAGYPVAVDADNPVEPFAFGFMGDDHRPSGDWDRPVLDALRELGTGMVYGDDGIKGESLPTAIFMTSDIVRALGYMAPPTFGHLYVDDAWLDLGRAAGCIRYLSHVKVGHHHPVAGLAAWDEGYARCNSPQQYQRDQIAHLRWRATELPAAAAKVRELRRRTSTASGQR